MRKSTKVKPLTDEPEKRERVLIPLLGDDISPRFDLAPEVIIATVAHNRSAIIEKSLVLSQASAEELCRLILTEKIDLVICCAIEEEFHQYLTWKKIKVIDSVVGPYTKALAKLETGTINEGEIL